MVLDDIIEEDNEVEFWFTFDPTRNADDDGCNDEGCRFVVVVVDKDGMYGRNKELMNWVGVVGWGE